MATIPKTVGEFSVLPVRLPQLPSLTLPTPATHYIYVRRNAPKIATEDDDRSLFLSNVPVDATEDLFRELFSLLVGAGRFESVTFEETRRQRREFGSDDEDGSEDDSGSELDVMPRHAANLKSLESRKRKRQAGGTGRGAEDDAKRTSNSLAQQRRQAKLPATWPRTLRQSGSTAVALLADAKSVEIVFKAIAKVHKSASPAQYPLWPASSALGPSWLAGHNRMAYPNHATLLASVDSFFALFNRKEAEAAELARRLRNVPDEDGFVTVTRASGGRSAPARQEDAVSARAKQLAKQEQQRSDMTSFYRFQLRERKKEEQSEMQRRFLDDQKRVAAMREKRGKFKPEA